MSNSTIDAAEIYTVHSAAEATGEKRQTIYSRIRAGTLKARRSGSTYLITGQALLDQTAQPPGWHANGTVPAGIGRRPLDFTDRVIGDLTVISGNPHDGWRSRCACGQKIERKHWQMVRINAGLNLASCGCTSKSCNKGYTPENLARQEAMVDRYLAGETKSAIAADYGISRERVRQIVKRHPRYQKRPKKVKVPAPLLEKVCGICDSPFTTRNHHKFYCSPECATEAMKRAKNATNADPLRFRRDTEYGQLLDAALEDVEPGDEFVHLSESAEIAGMTKQRFMYPVWRGIVASRETALLNNQGMPQRIYSAAHARALRAVSELGNRAS